MYRKGHFCMAKVSKYLPRRLNIYCSAVDNPIIPFDLKTRPHPDYKVNIVITLTIDSNSLKILPCLI